MTQLFYRIVTSATPTVEDFRSDRDRGLPPRGPQLEDLSLWTGFSVFDRREEAAKRARRYALGTHVVVLQLPREWAVDPLRVRKTLGVTQVAPHQGGQVSVPTTSPYGPRSRNWSRSSPTSHRSGRKLAIWPTSWWSSAPGT